MYEIKYFVEVNFIVCSGCCGKVSHLNNRNYFSHSSGGWKSEGPLAAHRLLIS